MADVPREWRQQLLVLALIVVALAATVVGAAVAQRGHVPGGAEARARAGQITAPSQVTVLVDAPGVTASSLGPNVQSLQSAAASN